MRQDSREVDWQVRAKRKASRWALLFAVMGAVLAVVYSGLITLFDFDAAVLDPLVMPATFIFFLGDWRGEFGPAVLLATSVNAAVWAGIGYLFGYGSAR